MKRALVIGGTRYFGKRLVHSLLARGLSVSVLNRGNTKTQFAGPVTELIGDRGNAERMKKVLKDQHWDVVFDQICTSPNDASLAKDLFADKTNRYILTSSQYVYLEKKADLPENAFDPINHDFSLGTRTDFDYAHCKRYAESCLLQNARFPVAAVRLPIVLGPDDYSGRLEFHISQVQNSAPLSVPNRDAEVSLMSSQEAADFLCWLGLDSTHEGPLNAASSQPLTIGEILEMIEKVVRRSTNFSDSINAERSSFVGENSYTMSLEKAKQLGASLKNTAQWLPQLIEQMVRMKSYGN